MNILPFFISPPAKTKHLKIANGIQRASECHLHMTIITVLSYHQSCHQSQNGVEFRKGGINHGVGHHVMTL